MSKLIGKESRQWRRLSDDSTWPVIEHDDDIDSVQWRLRYGTPTPEDIRYAASVIAAYEYLVYEASRDKSALVCRELRAGRREREDAR